MNATNKKTIQFAVLVLVGFNFWIWYSLLGTQNTENAVYFLDVGQGDSQLVTLSSGSGALPIKILIDGGRDKKVLDALDTALGTMNDKYIDIVIISNPDLDHFGGLIDIARRYEIELFVSTGYQSQTEAFRVLQEEISTRNIQTLILREGDRIRYKNNNFFVVSPDSKIMENESLNEASLVVMLEAGKSRALFTGDIGFSTENVLLEKGYNLKADALKVGHHGSKNSSGENFIAAVQPMVSIIGVGKNRYGHPTPRVLETLGLAGSKVYRTDSDGTIKIILDKDKGVFGMRKNLPELIASITEIMTGGYKNQDMVIVSLSELQNEPKSFLLTPYTSCSFQSAGKPSLGETAPIIINEVAWMGSNQSFTHEWIELRNISGDVVNMSGWQIINENEKIHVTFPQQSIFDEQFMILARSAANDTLEPDADLIFSGSIRNSNEGLRLFDNNCRLIDEVSASPSWPAGDNRTKQTMERTNDFGWVNSLTTGGTPGRENADKK